MILKWIARKKRAMSNVLQCSKKCKMCNNDHFSLKYINYIILMNESRKKTIGEY